MDRSEVNKKINELNKTQHTIVRKKKKKRSKSENVKEINKRLQDLNEAPYNTIHRKRD